jgi:poly(3-hydroxybutyrate) depolymerase
MRRARFFCGLVLIGACAASSDEIEITDDDTDAPVSYPDPVFGLSEQTLEHDGLTRTYHMYVPDTYDASAPVPLLLNMHGFGGDSEGQLYTADMRSLADRDNFILVYPQGALLDGYTHWNAAPPGGDNKSDVDDIGFFNALLDTLSENYAVDTSRVYATGYSNGAGMTYTLACYLSDRVTAIASVSGLMGSEPQDYCEPTHPTALMILHGTRDDARPYDGYPGYLASVEDTLSYWASHNQISGAPAETTFMDGGQSIERRDYTGGEGGVEMRLYKVINGQHIWFGFEDEGVQANALIWNFLSGFDQDGAM